VRTYGRKSSPWSSHSRKAQCDVRQAERYWTCVCLSPRATVIVPQNHILPYHNGSRGAIGWALDRESGAVAVERQLTVTVRICQGAIGFATSV
jgi:hypothetical protein